jgi:capsular exopolysaccharide synthesis family protein
MTSNDPPARLEDYLSVLRVRKGVIAIAILSVMAITFGLSLLQTEIYESEAKVLVEPLSLSPGEPATPPNMETEKEVVASAEVATRAAERLDYDGDVEALLEPLTAEVTAGAEIIVMRYEHPVPEEARRRARAFAEAYLEFRSERAAAELLTSREPLEVELARLDAELQRVNQEIADEVDPDRVDTLQAEAEALIGQIAIVQQQLNQMPTRIRVGQVVDAPDRPTSPSRPNLLMNLSLGLLVGAALGIGLAFLRERLTGHVRGTEDIESSVGAPVLGLVPIRDPKKDGFSADGAHLAASRSPLAEAYRTLRAGIAFASSRADTKTILITSPNPGEGKSSITANLGVSLAHMGKSVILVSADVRRPTLHRFFDLEDDTGLTDVLRKKNHPLEALTPTGIEDLMVMQIGSSIDDGDELLASEEMQGLLSGLRDIADFVLIDGAPILPVADALVVAPLVDAVLLIVDSKRTERGAVAEAVKRLERIDARVIGTVINRFDPSQARAYGYGGYGRGYEGRAAIARTAKGPPNSVGRACLPR